MGISDMLLGQMYLYVVSESGTIEPLELTDTLKAMPLVPGAPIIILSFL